jgi:hypothetical protein
MAALSRFISKLVERDMPFYRLLHKVDGLQWNDQVAPTLIKLKQYLKPLPTSGAPQT